MAEAYCVKCKAKREMKNPQQITMKSRMSSATRAVVTISRHPPHGGRGPLLVSSAVWWIGARLIAERERACDEEVVRRGCDPEAYAKGILNVCRLTWNLRSPARRE